MNKQKKKLHQSVVVACAALFGILAPLKPPASGPLPTLLPHPHQETKAKNLDQINFQDHFQTNKQTQKSPQTMVVACAALFGTLTPFRPPASNPL